MSTKQKEALKLALDALDEFCELGAIIRPLEVRDAIREALAEQPAQKQEPVEWDGRCVLGHCGSPTGCELSDRCRADCTSPQQAQPSKPLTDEQILNLVPGLQDCLCDPWDYNNSGDHYASIPKDMIRLARAIEAAHGIKEKNA